MAGLVTMSAADREAVLTATIARWASSGCAAFPCGLEVWRYACEASGAEVTALPPHQSRRQMSALLKREGGLVAYAGKLMTSLGWRAGNMAYAPRRGDVGVVNLGGMGLTCAICLGESQYPGIGNWMAKGDGHVLTAAAPRLAIWRLPCPRP